MSDAPKNAVPCSDRSGTHPALRLILLRYRGGEDLARKAQLQRRQQAESGVQLGDVAREMHVREYSDFTLVAQPQNSCKKYAKHALQGGGRSI
jgi:hypothetical protein